mgnify:CR=1 FL=1
MPIFESVVSFLSSPTGILLYYLILLFTLEIALGLCWGEWQRARNTRYRHLLLGFGGVLMAKLLVAGGEGLRLLNLSPDGAYFLFPPLAQALETVALVFLCWAFLPSMFKVRRTRYGLLWGSLGVTAALYLITQSGLLVVGWTGGPQAGAAIMQGQYWISRLWFLWQALLCAGLTLVYLWEAGRRRALIAMGFAALVLGRLLESLSLYPPAMTTPGPAIWEHLSNVIAFPLFAVVIYQATVSRLHRYNRELQDLSRESQRQVRDLFFLLETVKATTGSLDAQLTYNQVVENIALAMRADHCGLALCDPGDPRHVHLVATYDMQTRERLTQPLQLDLSRYKVLEVAVKRDRQVMIEQVEADPALKTLYLQLRGATLGPALFQSIAINNRVLGVLLLAKEGDETFTAEERTFCKNLARQIAAALENIRIYSASRQEMQQAIDLRDMTQALGTSLDLKHTLDTILVLAQRKIGYDMAEISLLDEDGHVTWIRGARDHVYSRTDVGQPLPPGPARWILEHRQALLIPQVTDPLPPRPEWADVPVTSFLGAPLRHQENLLGIIELARIRGAPFTEAHLQFLTHLTTVAAGAVERALSYQTMSRQVERSHRELRALQTVYEAIRSARPLPEVLDTILDEAIQATRSTCGTLVVLSEQEEEGLAYHLFRGLPAARETLWRRLGVTGSALIRAMRHGEALHIPDLAAEPELRPLSETGRAQLVVPLLSAASPSGGLILESPQANTYDTTDLLLAKTLADATALALVQERPAEKLSDQATQTLLQRQAQLQHLLAFKRSLTSSLDLTVSLSQALPLVLNAVTPPCSGATVLLFDAEINSLVPQVTVGYRARPFKLDEELAWQAMVQHKVLQNTEPDGSAMAVPLQVAEEFLGVLLLATPGRRLFDRDEVEYLSAMAQDMAEAIHQARLYHNLGQQVERLAALRPSLADQATTDSLRPILDSLPLGAMIADPAGRVTMHNDLAQRLLERTPLLNQNIYTLCRLADGTGQLLPAAAPLRQFQPVRQSLESGNRLVDVYLTPILAADGALLGYLALLRDEGYRAYQPGFLQGPLVQQLYEPLTAISGCLELLLAGRAGPLPDSAREHLQMAQGHYARLTQLLDGLACGPAPTAVARPPEPGQRPEPVARAAPHILVVDDEPDIARLVQHYLEQAGYTVVLAADGAAALDIVHRDRPDLILLDLFMPEMDGYAVIQQLRAHPATASIPVIVMSVLATNNQLGAVACVNKPLNRQQLLEAIDQALARVEQVLLVSTDAALVAELTARLSAQGYPVLPTNDERQALDLAGRPEVRLVVLDLRTSGESALTGEFLLNQMRQRAAAPPIVVLLDTPDPAQEERLLAQGANAVLSGPVEPTTLVGQIKDRLVLTTYYQDLVQATGADDPYLRWRATETLSQAPLEEVLGYLLAALRHPNPYTRLNAVDVLSRRGDRRAMLPLIGCLADDDHRVVSRAAEALGKLGDPRAIEPLIAHLRDGDALVRSKIVEALGWIGVGSQATVTPDSTSVIEPLLQALQDEDAGVRSRAAAALGLIVGRDEGTTRESAPPPAVIEALIAALEDPAPEVRERAVETLGRLGDERAIFPLRRLVTTPGQPGSLTPELAQQAIRQIRERSRDRRAEEIAEDQRRAKRKT